MPNTIGQPNSGPVGGGGDWFERVKQFGKMLQSLGALGHSKVEHESKLGEGKLSQNMTGAGSATQGASVLKRSSEYVPTQGSGRVAQSLEQPRIAQVKLANDIESSAKPISYSKELTVIRQFLGQIQSRDMNPSEIRSTINMALNSPLLDVIGALNHLGREGKLDEVLDALPISSVVLLASKDEELAEYIFGKLQPITLDAFEEERWEASEAEGMGGVPMDPYEEGYLAHRINNLDLNEMDSTERAQMEAEFRDINLILYGNLNQ